MINQEKKLCVIFFFPVNLFIALIELERKYTDIASRIKPWAGTCLVETDTEIDKINNLNPLLTKQTIWYVRPAKTHISIGKDESQASPGIYPV